MPAMAHTGAARAAVEELTRELAAEWASDGIAVVAAAIGRFDTESLRKYPEVVWRAPPARVPLQRLGSDAGVRLARRAARRRRSAARSRGSVVTLDGARDNWFGPWPPPTLTDDGGAVPTEERRRGPQAPR